MLEKVASVLEQTDVCVSCSSANAVSVIPEPILHILRAKQTSTNYIWKPAACEESSACDGKPQLKHALPGIYNKIRLKQVVKTIKM